MHGSSLVNSALTSKISEPAAVEKEREKEEEEKKNEEKEEERGTDKRSKARRGSIGSRVWCFV